jgi:hypothetical protein
VATLNPNLTVLDFYSGDVLRMKCTFHFFLQIFMIYKQELQAQLQNSRQTCFVTNGKKLIEGGIFVVLHWNPHRSVTLLNKANLVVLATFLLSWILSTTY